MLGQPASGVTPQPGLCLLRMLGSAQVTHTRTPTPNAQAIRGGGVPFLLLLNKQAMN